MTVVERADSLAIGSYKMEVCGTTLLHRLGIHDAVAATGTQMRAAVIVDRKGKFIGEMRAPTSGIASTSRSCAGTRQPGAGPGARRLYDRGGPGAGVELSGSAIGSRFNDTTNRRRSIERPHPIGLFGFHRATCAALIATRQSAGVILKFGPRKSLALHSLLPDEGLQELSYASVSGDRIIRCSLRLP